MTEHECVHPISLEKIPLAVLEKIDDCLEDSDNYQLAVIEFNRGNVRKGFFFINKALNNENAEAKNYISDLMNRFAALEDVDAYLGAMFEAGVGSDNKQIVEFLPQSNFWICISAGLNGCLDFVCRAQTLLVKKILNGEEDKSIYRKILGKISKTKYPVAFDGIRNTNYFCPLGENIVGLSNISYGSVRHHSSMPFPANDYLIEKKMGGDVTMDDTRCMDWYLFYISLTQYADPYYIKEDKFSFVVSQLKNLASNGNEHAKHILVELYVAYGYLKKWLNIPMRGDESKEYYLKVLRDNLIDFATCKKYIAILRNSECAFLRQDCIREIKESETTRIGLIECTVKNIYDGILRGCLWYSGGCWGGTFLFILIKRVDNVERLIQSCDYLAIATLLALFGLIDKRECLVKSIFTKLCMKLVRSWIYSERKK